MGGNLDGFIEYARQKLSEAKLLELPGTILYSSRRTLRPSNFYILGVNPGGVSGSPPLGHSLEGIRVKETNDYLCPDWENNKGPYRGLAPLQKRVAWLANIAGQKVEDICASNLIFLQSQSVEDLRKQGHNFMDLADKCWPVHQKLIEIIRPSTIFCFGNSGESPFQFIMNRHQVKDYQESMAHHANYKLRYFKVTGGYLNDVHVIGLPHLSRYKPEGKPDVEDWIKERIKM